MDAESLWNKMDALESKIKDILADRDKLFESSHKALEYFTMIENATGVEHDVATELRRVIKEVSSEQ